MKPAIELLKTKLLTDFPSGSSINYYAGNLYLIGDDANDLLVLDSNYKEINAVRLFNYPEKRIPKAKSFNGRKKKGLVDTIRNLKM